MSKIVILSGSPRKGGNTAMLAEAFAKGARENNSVEIISVTDYKINPCIGCNSCFQRKNHTCFQQDDMQKLYSKLEDADIIVIATPVYFYGVSAQLKAVVDRLHTPLRNRFKVQKLILLSVAAASLPAVFDAVKLQYQLVLDFFHLENAGMILVKGVKNVGDINQNPALEKAFQLGQRQV